MATATAAPPVYGTGPASYWRTFTAWIARTVQRVTNGVRWMFTGVVNTGARAWAWTRVTAASAWGWTKLRAASTLVLSKNVFWYTVGWILTTLAWIANLFLTGIGMIGTTAAYIIGGGLALAAAFVGFLGWGGLLLIVGITMLLLASSDFIRNFVAAPFRWMRRRSQVEENLADFINTPGGRNVAMHTEAHERPYHPGAIFNINAEGTGDGGQGGALYVLPERAEQLPKGVLTDYPIVGLMIGRGLRLPVLFDWSSLAPEDTDLSEMMKTMEYLQSQASTTRERSYWEGRLAAFAAFANSPEPITSARSNKARAMNYAKTRGAQQRMSEKYFNQGWDDMVHEFRAIRAREPVPAA